MKFFKGASDSLDTLSVVIGTEHIHGWDRTGQSRTRPKILANVQDIGTLKSRNLKYEIIAH
ncbi:hypothetical protein RhiirB3_459674 [Rhizophagus irregularis]|nr:hypothetical protein RhiirB3_459674 [Rhizophagus irregularis]